MQIVYPSAAAPLRSTREPATANASPEFGLPEERSLNSPPASSPLYARKNLKLTPSNAQASQNTQLFYSLLKRSTVTISQKMHSIPKLLHLTCEDPKKLSQELRDNIKNLSEKNPDWSIFVYGNKEREQFIYQNFDTYTLRRYRQINQKYGAARADFFRYLCLYKLGGVYLDIKSSTTLPLSTVIRPDDRFLISQWHNSPDPNCNSWGQHHELAHIPGGEYMQWMIITCAGHPYLKNVIAMVSANIDHYHRYYSGVGRTAVLSITGPIPYTLAIHAILNSHPHRFVDAFGEIGLRYSIYSDRRTHRQLQENHYSRIDEPLILRNRLSNACVFFCETLFRITPDRIRRAIDSRWIRSKR